MTSLVRVIALTALMACFLFVGCNARTTKSDAWSAARGVAGDDASLAKSLASSRLVEDGRGGVVARAWNGVTKMQGLTFGARLPSSATGAIDVGLATRDEARTDANRTTNARNATLGDYVLRVTHESLADAALAMDKDARAMYRDVAPSTDLLAVADDARAEWFYMLRDARAPSAFAMHVELGKGLTRVVTKRDGSLAFVDARGKTRLAMPQAYAVDARGVRRDVTLAWNAKSARLDVTLDARGLAFPVLLDPAIEHPVWELVVNGLGGPSARYGASMAYDSVRGVSVLFGGTSGSAANDLQNDVWEWNGTTWSSPSPVKAPSPRYNASMAFDSARGKTVLFGGENSGTAALGETWEWDGVAWTQLALVAAPPPRQGASMAFDSVRGKTVLFGGYSNGDIYLNDTWEWDGTSWTAPPISLAPPPRSNAAMVYDQSQTKTVLFGGCAAGICQGDTWEWDGTSWTQSPSSPVPPFLYECATAYDTSHSEMLVFGGTNGGNGFSDETYEWNGTKWTQLNPAPAPSPRWFSASTYDSARGKVVLFGGNEGAPLGDTWEWDGTTWTQRIVSTGPSARDLPSMVYDSARKENLLFGGQSVTGAYGNDLWAWDGTTWTLQVVSSAPQPRFTSMAYDSMRHVTVLFGGQANGTVFDDTWEYDGTAWTQRFPTTSHPLNTGAMVYDSAREETVLFSSATSSQTWTWDGNTWTELSPATSPPLRQGTSMVYDSARGRSVLFGGASGTTSLNDTWEWDGTDWTQIFPPVSPSARDYFAMAYDSVRGRTIIFGGVGPTVLDDTWEYDGTTWAHSSALDVPFARYVASLSFNVATGTTVLFGGIGATGYLGDTWEFFTIGAACTSTSTCDTGACTDGVCCNQAQCGACQACNLAGSEGTCTNVAAGTRPTTGDVTACKAPSICGATGGCGGPVGTACMQNADCVLGFCVDNVCCDTACTGDCQACGTLRGLTTNGTCAFAPEDEPGRNTCANNFACNGKAPACPVTCTEDASCATGYYCAANGSCEPQKIQGASCSVVAGQDCLGGNCRECAAVGSASTGQCVDNVCCDTACTGACSVCNASGSGGICTNAAAGAPGGIDGRALCAPYACTGASSSCGTTCASDADCASDAYCDQGSHMCTGTAKLGSSCPNDDACASQHCVDRTCCSSTCGAASDAGASTCQIGICNAATNYACQLPTGATVCRGETCASGVHSFTAVCDNDGGCTQPETQACAPYACDSTKMKCTTTCTSNADCDANTATCDLTSHTCVTGATCSTDGSEVIANNGTTAACSPYVCEASACAKSCSSIKDCATGFACDSTGMCVASSAASNAASPNSGCSCRAMGRTSSRGGIAFVMVGLGMALLRRRRSKMKRAYVAGSVASANRPTPSISSTLSSTDRPAARS